jgi:hypothetical protein
MNFVKFLLTGLIIFSSLFVDTTAVQATGTGSLYFKGGGFLDQTSVLSIDPSNRKLFFQDGFTTALDWSSAGKILINGASSSTDNSVLQVAGGANQNLAHFYNDTNYFTIKSDGQIETNTPDGTKPFAVTSTTTVNNLNADLLDGYDSLQIALDNSVVKYAGGLTLPTIVGQSGKFLTNNGSTLSWTTVVEADTLASVTSRGGITTTPLTLGQLTITDGYNIILGTSGGTKIGTATNQKLGFYNATPIVQPANTVALDTALANLGLRASGNPFVSTNFRIGTATAGADYTLTFDGENSDGILTWLEDEDQFRFNDRIQTNGGIIGKVTTVTDTYTILPSDETIVGNKSTAFTITLPTAVTGQIFTVSNIGAGVITLDGAGSDTISGVATQTINQWSVVKIQCISANTWAII